MKTARARTVLVAVLAWLVVATGLSPAHADAVVARDPVGFQGKESELLKKLDGLGYKKVAYGNSVYIAPNGKAMLGWVTAFQLVHKTDNQLIAYGIHDLMVEDPRIEVYQMVPATWGKRSKLFVNKGKDLREIKKSPVYEFCTQGGNYDPLLIAVAERNDKQKHQFTPLKAWKIDPTTAQLTALPTESVTCTCNSLTCDML